MRLDKIYFLIEREWNGSRYSDPDEVIKLCDEALSIEPSSVLVLYHKGLAYLSYSKNVNENIRQAQKCFNDIVHKTPQFWRAWHNLGVCYEMQGEQFLTNALYCYSKARQYENKEKNKS